ncbi:beta-ketoacyl synthase N-terminal-like domain-containing protein, partial [Pseudomonas mandelii]|uniref:beta-ketoacyl synthase N-terminal-like domain-containing protein n=1 Tax=Pseudomonas mandelii TaxID=75612 RepID=UPI003D07EBBB
MRRVVITGLGIVSCLGNDKETVSANLRASRPGIRFNPATVLDGRNTPLANGVQRALGRPARDF